METQIARETNQEEPDDKKSQEERVASAPSLQSSPSHEFSFKITLHPPPNSTPNAFSLFLNNNNNYTSRSDPLTLNLAPADEIFFHGHLLPLHLLSHPRRSIDVDLTLPSSLPYTPTVHHQQQQQSNITSFDAKEKKKSLLFGLSKLWLKGSGDEVDSERQKKKKKAAAYFDMKHFWKKYATMLSSPNKEKRKDDVRQQKPCTFSSKSNAKERDRWQRKTGEFSAPASIRTSPTNSGLLLASPAACSPSNNSSVEELQSAIQAAIAHCKNSTRTTKQGE